MKVKCALVQMNYSTDVAENVATAAEYVREAGRQGARVICLPELTTTQNFCVGMNREFIRSLWSAPNGELVATAGTDGDEILHCEVDTDLSKRLREEWGFFRDRRPEAYTEVTAR